MSRQTVPLDMIEDFFTKMRDESAQWLYMHMRVLYIHKHIHHPSFLAQAHS